MSRSKCVNYAYYGNINYGTIKNNIKYYFYIRRKTSKTGGQETKFTIPFKSNLFYILSDECIYFFGKSIL